MSEEVKVRSTEQSSEKYSVKQRQCLRRQVRITSIYLVFCNEGFHLFNLLRDDLFIPVAQCGFSPLQPGQQGFQQLLLGDESCQGTG